VLAEAEDGGSLLGVLAADAFEDRGAVAAYVGEDVERGVVPIDPFSVVPDFLGLVDGHLRSSSVPPIAEYGRGGEASIGGRYWRSGRERQIGA